MSWDLNVDNTEILSTTQFSNNWKFKIITGIIKFSKNIIESLFTHVKTISQNQVKQVIIEM